MCIDKLVTAVVCGGVAYYSRQASFMFSNKYRICVSETGNASYCHTYAISSTALTIIGIITLLYALKKINSEAQVSSQADASNSSDQSQSPKIPFQTTKNAHSYAVDDSQISEKTRLSLGNYSPILWKTGSKSL